ncbi:MAG: hypothetical protein HKN87_03510 [Saprospiraceae bacterium]|nr:hypothetical protein [Saprospiraceae bacterium]
MFISKSFILFSVCLIFASCGSEPKVIQPKSGSSEEMETDVARDRSTSDVHEVVVEDFLHASRYTYLQVKEQGESFWIAVPFTEVEKGKRYFYQGGMRMENFKSKEHDRVFERLYLVDRVSEIPSMDPIASDRGEIDMHGGKVKPLTESIQPIEGGIGLAQLFSDPAKYNDQILLVKGQCVKVNQNIMGKNWVHLQDGSKDDSDDSLDLTITTKEEVQVGAVVSFEGKIATDRDIGSGYHFDIIMEEAVLVN